MQKQHPYSDEHKDLVAELEQKITDLEIRVSYQDETLQEMEKTLAVQQQAIQQQAHKFRLLGDYLKSLKDEPIKPLSEETRPPHY